MKKFKIALAKMGKFTSIIVLVVGSITLLVTLGFLVYAVATQTHNGVLEMSDSDRFFYLGAMDVSVFIILIGGITVDKTDYLIKKLTLV